MCVLRNDEGVDAKKGLGPSDFWCCLESLASIAVLCAAVALMSNRGMLVERRTLQAFLKQ